ncbi:MAG TPA: hypothetical protein VIZ30_11575 [Pseudomonadales bacterium]
MSETERGSKHWSDAKTDVVATLVIFAAALLAAVHFISNQT